MSILLQLMTGVDIPIPECQLTIHQPTIREISMIGEQMFFLGVSLLTLNKTKIKVLSKGDSARLNDLDNFTILTEIYNQDQTQKEVLKTVLMVFFPKYKIIISPRSIIFTDQDDNISTLDKDNFSYLSNIVLKIAGLDNNSQEAEFNTVSKKAKEIQEKLLRARERVAAQKGQEAGNSSPLTQYVSVLSVCIPGLSLVDAIELTLFQMYDLLERHGLYTTWDIDLKTRLAGGKPDKTPDHWMKKLY